MSIYGLEMATPATRKRRQCPPGKIYRQGYYRRYSNTVKREGYLVKRGDKMVRIHPETDAVYVEPTCIEAADEIASSEPFRKGQLLRYGYNFRLPRTSRHDALKKAERVYGAAFVHKQLGRAYKLFHKSKSQAAKVFAEDRDWMKTTYSLGK
jgi:hypothetical protein